MLDTESINPGRSRYFPVGASLAGRQGDRGADRVGPENGGGEAWAAPIGAAIEGPVGRGRQGDRGADRVGMENGGGEAWAAPIGAMIEGPFIGQ